MGFHKGQSFYASELRQTFPRPHHGRRAGNLIFTSPTTLHCAHITSMITALLVPSPVPTKSMSVIQQGFHTQFGPKQSTVVRWASSHNNTFALAVVAAVDQKWFYDKDYFAMLDDYIDSAPSGANEVRKKPRWHGASKPSSYLNSKTNTACAGGHCVKDLFTRQVPKSDPECMFLECSVQQCMS